MNKGDKVLIIGAAGRIGSGFKEEYLEKYSKKYDLILGVHMPGIKSGGLEVRKVDITKLASVEKSLKGIDCVILLAANPDANAKFKDLLDPNIIGAYNVFEAARIKGCKRVIFASSVHTILGYDEKRKVREMDPPIPSDLYGATKAWGEALCGLYSKKHGLSCLAIRIGAYTSNDQRKVVCLTRTNFDYIISQRDMGQLIHKCIISPEKVRYGVLDGTSDNKKKKMSLRFTKKLVGYKPEDDAFKLCNVVRKKMGK